VKPVLTLPLALPLALAGNRVRWLADILEERGGHQRAVDRLERLHEAMLYLLIRMQD
jgi:hypothetical protein